MGLVADESGDTNDEADDRTGELACGAGDEEVDVDVIFVTLLVVLLLAAIEANSLILT